MSGRRETDHLGEVYMILRDRKRLKRLMICQEESQRSLATAAGWRSHSYLGRLLRGEEDTLDTEPALRIAHHLRVPVDDLFATKVDSKPGHHHHKSGSRRSMDQHGVRETNGRSRVDQLPHDASPSFDVGTESVGEGGGPGAVEDAPAPGHAGGVS